MLGMRSFPFPIAIGQAGVISDDADGDAQLRGKLIQVLFTAPGERVNLPDFGCGLFDRVFDPNNDVLAASVKFSVGQALMRWLGDEIVVSDVGISGDEESISLEVVYIKRADLTRRTVRVHFR